MYILTLCKDLKIVKDPPEKTKANNEKDRVLIAVTRLVIGIFW